MKEKIEAKQIEIHEKEGSVILLKEKDVGAL